MNRRLVIAALCLLGVIVLVAALRSDGVAQVLIGICLGVLLIGLLATIVICYAFAYMRVVTPELRREQILQQNDGSVEQ